MNTTPNILRILVIGAGGIGAKHIRALFATGRAAVSICEPDPAKCAALAAEHPIAQTYASLDDAPLSQFDAAWICAPANFHIPLGMRLARAGVPFLMEKPLAASPDGVRELLQLVAQKQLPVRVGYLRRVALGIPELKAALADERCGRVLLARVNSGQDYRKYRPDYQQIYYARRDMGGGAIMDAAAHYIDLLLHLFGPVAEVSAVAGRLDFENVECEDSVLVSLRFRNHPALAQLTLNQFQKPNIQTIELIGNRANLVWDEVKGTLAFAGDDSGQWERCDLYEGRPIRDVMARRFQDQAESFLDLMAGKPSALATLEDAFANLRVCLAIRQAAESGRTVAIAEQEPE